MKIELYPKFENVFIDDTLKGIFYPLCSLTLDQYPDKIFHFISSNGLWMDENFETESNTFSYTLFDVIDNKYKFNGNIKLYKGFEEAKKIFESLQKDFENNGETYLKNQVQTDNYVEQQKHLLRIETNDDFDLDYYLQTFYEFEINKLNFELNNKFGAFGEIFDGWSKSNKSPIVYDEKTDELKGTLNHCEKPKIENIDKFEVIGKIVGCEFFTDGNDTVLFFNNSTKILCLNSYS